MISHRVASFNWFRVFFFVRLVDLQVQLSIPLNSLFTLYGLFEYITFLLRVEGGLNLSSSQAQSKPAADNRTIQSFVKVYVDKYVGEYMSYCMYNGICVPCIFCNARLHIVCKSHCRYNCMFYCMFNSINVPTIF